MRDVKTDFYSMWQYQKGEIIIINNNKIIKIHNHLGILTLK